MSMATDDVLDGMRRMRDMAMPNLPALLGDAFLHVYDETVDAMSEHIATFTEVLEENVEMARKLEDLEQE